MTQNARLPHHSSGQIQYDNWLPVSPWMRSFTDTKPAAIPGFTQCRQNCRLKTKSGLTAFHTHGYRN